ncbi:MAG: hypothetical protein ABSD67_12505 [Terracidiphilus sp.]|jgi:hypothetical protein
MKNSLLTITLTIFACALITNAQDATPSGPIFYTGQLDGFLGSWTRCQPLTDGGPSPCDKQDWKFDKKPGSILVGLGDNLAPDPESFAPGKFPDRLTPHPLQLNVVRFLAANYDAVVPGKQDFIFGVNFLRALGLPANMENQPAPMIANNLVVQQIPQSTCASSPALTPTAPLLPDQVSLAAASAGSGGGGKGGKGGKGGGGGSAGAAGSPGGGASSGAASGCTPGVTDPEQHPLSKKETANFPKPNMLWPSKDDVYPWTSQFTIDTVDVEDSAHKPVPILFWLCRPEERAVSKAQDESLNTAACTPLTPDTQQTVSGAERLLPSSDPTIPPPFALVDESGRIADPPTTTKARYRLYPATQARLCYTFVNTKSTNGTDHQCTDNFTVQTPLFNYAWRVSDNADYVIFGALAPDTLNGVSDTDKSWITAPKNGAKKDEPQIGSSPSVLNNTDLTHQVQVNDPTSAILQALHTYNLLHSQSKHKKYGVVLAQMTPSEARSLAGDFASSAAYFGPNDAKIRVVISEANVYEASVDTRLTMNPAGQGEASTPGNASNPEFVPVFTPAPLFDRFDCLSLVWQSPESTRGCMAEVDFETDATHNLPATQVPSSLPKRADAWKTPYCSDNDVNEQNGKPVAPNPINNWECHLLSSMRLDTSALPRIVQNGTDVAVLEEKDFDFVRGLSSIPPQDSDFPAAAKILWKAGRLARVSLLGSTLRTLLKQNDNLQKKTYQTERETIESQQLKIDGIYKDRSGNYFINGMPLMASQIYSVATSDQLANSTSDYPQLAQKDLDNPDLYPIQVHPTQNSVQIRSHTCNIAYIGAQALKSNPVSCSNSQSHLLTVAELETHYDQPITAAVQPQSSGPAFTYSNRAYNKAADSSTENDAQGRPYFRATMQQLAFSYALNRPNQTSAGIGTNLSGVTNPNVASPYSRNWSLLQGGRLEWYEPRLNTQVLGFPWFEDIGVDTQVNLAQSIQGSLTPQKAQLTTTQQPIPANSTSITGNTLGFSPFLEFQFRTHPDWKPFVTRFLYSHNLWALPNYLTGCSATSPTCIVPSSSSGLGSFEFFLSQAQSNFYGASAGARYERNDFQYIEFGYIDQKQTNVLSALTFVPGPNFPNSTPPKCLSVTSGKSYACPLTGNETPATFASGIYPANGSSMTATYAAFHQQGAYVDLFYNYFVKHLKGILLQESIYGNYFAYGNRNESILTHYAFNSSGSVLFQLPANFSIGPTLGEFVYQSNAARGSQRSLTRMTAGAQFNYSFDWHTGVSRNAFIGNAP